MVEVEDLREGNFITPVLHSESHYYKVVSISENKESVTFVNCSKYSEPLNAKGEIALNVCFLIPITPELLEHSSFRQTRPLVFEKDGMIVQFKRYGVAYVQASSEDTPVAIEGVNELQNAYKHFTGNELAISFG
jgi:hypothetical protein